MQSTTCFFALEDQKSRNYAKTLRSWGLILHRQHRQGWQEATNTIKKDAIMKKDMIFFSTEGKGLTSTSANHIANLAKEMVREIETFVSGLTLYSTSVVLIGNDNVNIIN